MGSAKWDRTKGRPEPIRALNRIIEQETGEAMVDMRVSAPSLRFMRPGVIPYCRSTVATMAEKAAQSLPKGFHLGLVEAWRPFERQRRIYDFFWSSAVEAFPARSRAALRRTVCRFVAPVDQSAPPGHCTGAALDVHLVDDAGAFIDVTSPFERFAAAPTYAIGLSEEAHGNRVVLVDAMLSAGFSNCRDEWWHYSFGDSGWAVRTGHLTCPYGLVELDATLYEENERLWLEAFGERQNPFLPNP